VKPGVRASGFLFRHILLVVKLKLTIDDEVYRGASKTAKALHTSVDQMIIDYLKRLAGMDNVEADMEEFRRLSGRGYSRGWRFNRDEIYERK
jgi:hypothetical protein